MSDTSTLFLLLRFHSGLMMFLFFLKDMAERRHLECDVCGREFTRQSSVNRHMRTHTGERPYERDVCHKTFTRNHLLVGHKRTRTDERPYECDACLKNRMRLACICAPTLENSHSSVMRVGGGSLF